MPMRYPFRKSSPFVVAGLFWVLTLINATVWGAPEDKRSGGPRMVSTMSEVNEILRFVDFEVLLRTDTEISKGIGLAEGSYLLPLANYLDFNFIGAGKSVRLDPEAIIRFILTRLAQGENIATIGLGVVAEFKRSAFLPTLVNEAQKSGQPGPGQTHVGGFLVAEFEYHQEPDGKYLRLLEINQARLYFSTQLNSDDAKNNISLLAEYNPVPEEVIHQIDEITVSRNGINDTLRAAENEIEGLIPFERLHIKVSNIANHGVTLTVGQFRNPFGLWSDYTSHRNFSSTKNNALVNGFALKKIELGLLVEKSFAGGFDLQAALVHGRQGRTFPLDRADRDDKKDFVGRFGFSGRHFSWGVSSYLAEFSLNKNVAFGLDGLLSTNRLSLSGELVLQKNKALNSTFGTAFAFNRTSAQALYIQFDYSATPKFHVYGFYETWRFFADDALVLHPAYKIFHGLRYNIHPQLRWTIFEFGRMFHRGFDQGKLHLSTQLEMTY